MTMKLEKLKHEIIFNEDKLFEENEMLKGRLKQENINYNQKLDSLQSEKEALFEQNDKLKRIIEEKDVNLDVLLKQETDKYKMLNGERSDLKTALEQMTSDYENLLVQNEEYTCDLKNSEDLILNLEEKIKDQSQRHKEDINKIEQKIARVQKDNLLKSHKINFLLEKIESDCEKWNSIENDLNKEISSLNSALSLKERLLSEKNETIAKIRYFY